MEKHPQASSWQELLAGLIVDVRERERLAAAIQVQPITLIRWAERDSRPRLQNIRRLLAAMPPALFQNFFSLASIDFPSLTPPEADQRRQFGMLRPEFYAQILQAFTKLPPLLSRQSIQDLFLQQAIGHLDPQRHGMSISLATCVRPLEGQVVRSLREIGGIGTSPWNRDLEQRTLLLGAESLAGYALTQFRRVIVANRAATTRVPVHWTIHEQSAIAIPIARYARVSGCLLAASVMPNYFQDEPEAVMLLEQYANLGTLLFEESDFYPIQSIQLRLMPSYEAQLPCFQQVGTRILQQFRLAQVRGESCTLEQARHQVWREIEEELIQTGLNIESLP